MTIIEIMQFVHIDSVFTHYKIYKYGSSFLIYKL